MNMLPLTFIPNTKGYSFLGITKDCVRILCKVEQDSNGMHYVVDEHGERCYSKLKGWMKA